MGKVDELSEGKIWQSLSVIQGNNSYQVKPELKHFDDFLHEGTAGPLLEAVQNNKYGCGERGEQA